MLCYKPGSRSSTTRQSEFPSIEWGATTQLSLEGQPIGVNDHFPDSIVQPIIDMPLSRQKNPTFVKPHIKVFPRHGVEDCFTVRMPKEKTPIQRPNVLYVAIC
ncbi:hypothetical protein TNCV_174981 [Trichonephila clavipes]|nr:hypothetical protein TNCV_174981 [Trichonephila clavipes]